MMLEAKLQRVQNLRPLVCEMGNHEGFDKVGAWYNLRLGRTAEDVCLSVAMLAFTDARGFL